MVSANPGINDFVLVVLDLYGMKADDAVARLERSEIVNTSDFCTYTDSETKKKSYIIGISDYNDNTLNSNQIWFDSETLLPQMVLRTRNDGKLHSIRFDNYIQVGGCGWLPQKITYSVDGQVRIIERIYDAIIPIYERKEISVDNFCDNETINEMQLNPNSNFSLNFMVEP